MVSVTEGKMTHKIGVTEFFDFVWRFGKWFWFSVGLQWDFRWVYSGIFDGHCDSIFKSNSPLVCDTSLQPNGKIMHSLDN